MSTGYFPKREKVGLEDLFKGLVTAGHILHHHGVLDAHGHISVRSPDNPKTFWMLCDIPAALASTPEDLVEYNVEDASAVEKNAPKGDEERSIDSEIYKRFPNVNSVVHSRCPEVLPYCISEVPLKASLHSSAFLGSHVPVWTGKDATTPSTQDSASYAASFKPPTSAAFIYSKFRSALPQQIGGSQEPDKEPDHAVVLMKHHGFTTIAHGIEEAVYQAIFTREAAKVQTAALTLYNVHIDHAVEGKVDVQGGGQIKSAKVKADGGLAYLSDKAASDAWEKSRDGVVARSYRLWCREVEAQALYRNDCPGCEDE